MSEQTLRAVLASNEARELATEWLTEWDTYFSEEERTALADLLTRYGASERLAAFDKVVYMLQGMQADVPNYVDRGNVIDRVRGLKKLEQAAGEGKP